MQTGSLMYWNKNTAWPDHSSNRLKGPAPTWAVHFLSSSPPQHLPPASIPFPRGRQRRGLLITTTRSPPCSSSCRRKVSLFADRGPWTSSATPSRTKLISVALSQSQRPLTQLFPPQLCSRRQDPLRNFRSRCRGTQTSPRRF